MNRSDLHIPKELLIQSDVQNTVHGGVSFPSAEVTRKEDHYLIQVEVPAVSADSLKVDVEGHRLMISRLIEVKDEGFAAEGDPLRVPNLVQVLPIPHDVDLKGIRADHDGRSLRVVLPLNEYANGYRKSVEIER